MQIEIKTNQIPDKSSIIALYEANNWSSAKKPDKLFLAISNSQKVITAYSEDELVGLGNAISDGHLVVYYPHLLVHPNYHGMGIGGMIMKEFQSFYSKFHQQILVADGKAINFYEKCGFVKAGATQSMWIYQGQDH